MSRHEKDPIDEQARELAAEIIRDIDGMMVRFGQSGDAPPEMVVRVWRIIDRDPGSMDPLTQLGVLVTMRAFLAGLDGLGEGGES
jgi:hypothetical protein